MAPKISIPGGLINASIIIIINNLFNVGEGTHSIH